MVDFLFLSGWLRGKCYNASIRRNQSGFLDFSGLLFQSELPAFDVINCVIIGNNWQGWIGPVVHPSLRAIMAEVSFLGAVITIGTFLAGLWISRLADGSCSGCKVVLSPDLWTGVDEVSGHAAAVASFIPKGSLQTVVRGVAGQRTVRAVTVRTGPQ